MELIFQKLLIQTKRIVSHKYRNKITLRKLFLTKLNLVILVSQTVDKIMRSSTKRKRKLNY